ncbi:hypothetical protein NL108_014494 [Boleophthalmus pectinirostris]|uniref:capZ-interacting protein n=1 Tax=Boleophthalmus pectinirostris TaxID=150288 RepID=UPI0024312057|nr:capZ-interacting protein [Boleophthalmus pectinirostris]KAJ0063961.1 hypothetical protein NL108_014494 [Boleophthalmus pectinirostris]
MCPQRCSAHSLRAPGSTQQQQRRTVLSASEQQLLQANTSAGTHPRMEKESPSKPSVAELAGRFKGHILPMPTSNDEPPRRRRPPCSLKLQNQKDNNEDSPKPISPSNPVKVRTRNSALIEKLQANLALSPTALLPSPKSPDVKLQPPPLSPPTSHSPPTPLSPGLRPPQPPGEEEEPVCFETPAEGNTLPSFNKSRPRLSFKRRPPTRQHRRSTGEEPTSPGSSTSPCEQSQPNENGLGEQVPHSPAEEAAGGSGEKEEEVVEEKHEGDGDRDCSTIAEEEGKRDRPEEKAESEEKTGEEERGEEECKMAEGQEEEQQKPPSEPCDDKTEGSEEKMEEEAEKDANEGM